MDGRNTLEAVASTIRGDNRFSTLEIIGDQEDELGDPSKPFDFA